MSRFTVQKSLYGGENKNILDWTLPILTVRDYFLYRHHHGSTDANLKSYKAYKPFAMYEQSISLKKYCSYLFITYFHEVAKTFTLLL